MHRGQQGMFFLLKQLKADPRGSGGGSLRCYPLKGQNTGTAGLKGKTGVFLPLR